MRKLVAGVDNGLKGAIAVVDALTLELVQVIDMPVTTKERASGKDKNVIDIVTLNQRYIEMAHAGVIMVGIEGVFATMKDAVHSLLTVGQCQAYSEMACVAHGMPSRIIYPSVWKAEYLFKSTTENESLRVARAMFPGTPSETWYGVRGGIKDGRCDAALIARYTARKYLL